MENKLTNKEVIATVKNYFARRNSISENEVFVEIVERTEKTCKFHTAYLNKDKVIECDNKLLNGLYDLWLKSLSRKE